MSHIIGDNSHGNSNEQRMVDTINGKSLEELSLNLKNFIEYIGKTENILIHKKEKIKATLEKDNKKKQDFYVKIHETTVAVSLKMGSGNSFHQEKCENFVEFIKELGGDHELCKEIRFFIWADGTLDGTAPVKKNTSGHITCRIDAARYKREYPQKRKRIQDFLTLHERSFITRFMIEGNHASVVDYFYHGTPQQGEWVSAQRVISYQIAHSKTKNPKNRANLVVGKMNLQVWNVSKNGKNEKKRGEIQVKYPDVEKDLLALMNEVSDNTGTFFGDTQEFQLTRLMNHNKSHQFWKVILPEVEDYSNYFLVKVENKVLSSLSGQKVNCKSDAYVIKKSLDSQFLLQHQHTLNENLIEECHKFAVEDTGISIKIKDSNKFTYQKLTKMSFLKAFSSLEDVEHILLGLLLYSKGSELWKNSQIYENFGTTEAIFLAWARRVFRTDEWEFFVDSSKDDDELKMIRKCCQQKVIDKINQNSDLYEQIFRGKGWFESPYYISYIYKNGKLSQNYVEDFTITTGSGRSKGSYSIEIKPK